MDLETIILPLHILSLIYVVWNVYHADHMGFDWFRGKKEILDEKLVMKYHRGSFLGLGLMIFTGFLLFWPLREYLLSRPQFYIKMGFVFALIINGFVIKVLSKRAITNKFSNLSLKEKIPLFISGAISTVSWLGAFIMAFFLESD
jgi:hypothetical protein